MDNTNNSIDISLRPVPDKHSQRTELKSTVNVKNDVEFQLQKIPYCTNLQQSKKERREEYANFEERLMELENDRLSKVYVFDAARCLIQSLS